MEFLVCCVFAYWLAKHLPEVVGEAAQAFAAGLRGEESPAMAARRQRLKDAGVDPATGGAFRQFAGNTWRDFWLDQDQARAKRRTNTSPRGTGPDRSVFDRIRDAFDNEVDRRAQAWRARKAGATNQKPSGTPNDPGPATEPSGPPGPNPGSPTGNEQEPAPEPTQEPVRVPSTLRAPDTDSNPGAPRQPPVPPPALGAPTVDPAPATTDTDSRPAVRVPSTLGSDPAAGDTRPFGTTSTTTALLEPEGITMTDVATRGTAVTGVVSGAAEARSIQRALDAATDAYNAAVANARARIHALGEQTVGTVQMATRSRVVEGTAQAAEAIAAAQNGVNVCKAEVIPILGMVARHFDRLNS